MDGGPEQKKMTQYVKLQMKRNQRRRLPPDCNPIAAATSHAIDFAVARQREQIGWDDINQSEPEQLNNDSLVWISNATAQPQTPPIHYENFSTSHVRSSSHPTPELSSTSSSRIVTPTSMLTETALGLNEHQLSTSLIANSSLTFNAGESSFATGLWDFNAFTDEDSTTAISSELILPKAKKEDLKFGDDGRDDLLIYYLSNVFEQQYKTHCLYYPSHCRGWLLELIRTSQPYLDACLALSAYRLSSAPEIDVKDQKKMLQRSLQHRRLAVNGLTELLDRHQLVPDSVIPNKQQAEILGSISQLIFLEVSHPRLSNSSC
jgi:hypothetical protein